MLSRLRQFCIASFEPVLSGMILCTLLMFVMWLVSLPVVLFCGFNTAVVVVMGNAILSVGGFAVGLSLVLVCNLVLLGAIKTVEEFRSSFTGETE